MPHLAGQDGHQVYYHLQGTLNGDTPILFLHGGPGAACQKSDHELLKDCSRPVIFLDQRGCGKSLSDDLLTANTTHALLKDIERLRQQLNVQQFILLGGSWGSTLALSYAIHYPKHVERMILWGIFLCNSAELNWFYREGANWIFPEEYQRFIEPINNLDSVIEEYHQLVTHGSIKQRQQYAAQWARWEAVNSFIQPDESTLQQFSDPETSLPMVILETRYFSNLAFLAEDNFILKHIDSISHIPLDIVHGRYDTICPTRSAWLVAQSMQQATMHESPLAAHDASEPQNRAKLKQLISALN